MAQEPPPGSERRRGRAKGFPVNAASGWVSLKVRWSFFIRQKSSGTNPVLEVRWVGWTRQGSAPHRRCNRRSHHPPVQNGGLKGKTGPVLVAPVGNPPGPLRFQNRPDSLQHPRRPRPSGGSPRGRKPSLLLSLSKDLFSTNPHQPDAAALALAGVHGDTRQGQGVDVPVDGALGHLSARSSLAVTAFLFMRM